MRMMCGPHKQTHLSQVLTACQDVKFQQAAEEDNMPKSLSVGVNTMQATTN